MQQVVMEMLKTRGEEFLKSIKQLKMEEGIIILRGQLGRVEKGEKHYKVMLL